MCGSSSKARAGGEHLVGMNLDHGGALAGVWGGHLLTMFTLEEFGVLLL